MTAASELVVVESPGVLEIESPMLVGKRTLFFLLGLRRPHRRSRLTPLG